MSTIRSNRDYHLAKFRVGKYLEKGVDMLSETEEQDLNNLITDMREYESANVPAEGRTALNSLLNEYLEDRNRQR